MATQTFRLGMNAKFYFGAAGAMAATEIGNARDVTITLDKGEADVTTRANGGWRATAGTLKSCTIEWEMLWQPSDPAFAAIRSAYLTDDLVALMPLDSADGEGPDADFSITNFSRSEPLEEGIKVSVTAKLAVFREWHGAA